MPYEPSDSKKIKGKSKTKPKTRKSKGKKRPVSFAEEHEKSKDDDSKSKSVPKIKSKDKKPASEIEANAVPNPVPDTGTSRTTYYATTMPPSTSLLPSVISTSGSTPMVTVLGAITSSGISTILPSPTTSSIAAAASLNSPTSSKHPSTVVIVILSILAACVLFGLLAAAWVYSRPKKRSTPTPSLPILQEDYSDEKLDADEESLFGGKERSSTRPGDNSVPYTWTQYPHTSVIQSKSYSASGTPATLASKRVSTFPDEKSFYPFKGQGVTSTTAGTPSSPPLQQLQSAITRAASRVSAISASIYPTSPQTTHNYSGIGMALGGDSPLTADGMPVLQRSVSKSSTRRHSKTPKTDRQSTAGFDMITIPTNLNVSRESDIHVPAIPPPAGGMPVSSSGGRARVQGPYAPAVSMRASSSIGGLASSRFSVVDRNINPFESSTHALPPLPPVNKTDIWRERDTKALTSALGLQTPPPPLSPQGTLYPDDSITLAGDRRRSRAFSHSRMRSQVISPTIEASARLGNLMLENFQSSLTINPPSRPTGQGNTPTRPKPAIKKRTEDKPPRVPSPPPMPSLAQMAMENANPGDFADYRSPTYSIYGFYEMDRKSTSTDRKRVSRRSMTGLQ